MPNYTAPLDDMLFLFDKLRDNKNYNELQKYNEVNSDLVKDILGEAAKISENLILPLALSGDEHPAQLENGVVRTPPGYKEAYNKYIEDGWISLSCDPKYGGQGMPKTVSAFFDEMLSSTSLSFKLYSELTIGAYNCLLRHATDEMKDKYLPKMVEGKWSGTMCLTEPVCGTDLGLLKTKAEKQNDGTHKISGQKIFITSGDHDLTENIIHLVLAKIPGGPAGTKGISLFLVPKFNVNENTVVADIGCAEANFSLDVVDKVKHIYLFETNNVWEQPLKSTFEKYKDKVTIVNKKFSNIDSKNSVNGSKFLLDKGVNFIKIDVDGYENEVMSNIEEMITNSNDMKIALCTYHAQEDYSKYSKILKSFGFDVKHSKSYMIFYWDKNLKFPFLRRGLIRAKK